MAMAENYVHRLVDPRGDVIFDGAAQVGSQQDAQAVQDNSFWHHSNSPSCGPAI